MAPSPASLLPSHRQLSLLQTPPLTLLSGLLPRAIEARASSSSLSAGAIAGIVLSGLTLCTVLMTIILYFRQPRTHRSVPPPRPHSNLSFRCATRVTPTAAQFPSHHNAEVAERKISHPVPFSAASSPPSSNDELPLNPWNGQVAWPIKSVAHSSPTVTTPDPIHVGRTAPLHDAGLIHNVNGAAVLTTDRSRPQRPSLWYREREFTTGPVQRIEYV